jgi:mRNA interferase RelE/StbE
MTYEIVVQPRARKAYLALDGPVRKRIRAAIDALATDPRPPGAKALVGMSGVLRVRVGDYRILYEVQTTSL